MNTKRYFRIVLAVGCLFAAQSAQAFLMNYGDFSDAPCGQVVYMDVTEQNSTVATPFFGAPQIQCNTLDFDPVNFKAGPINNGSQIVDGQLNTTIMSLDNSFPISNLIIREAGDFTLTGLGPALAEVTVSMNARFSVTHVNGLQLPAPLAGTGVMTFTPASVPNGKWTLPAFAGTGTLWDGALDIDLDAFLASQNPPVQGHVTKVEFNMDNTLTAAAANGGSAFIAKKEFQGVTITVPEPASFGALAALAGLVLAARRRLVG